MIEGSALFALLISAFVVGLFAALKYYANTLGNTPENFEMRKFLPIMLLSIIISIAIALNVGVVMTPEGLAEYISANFMLVVFANTVWGIIVKKYPGLDNIFNI